MAYARIHDNKVVEVCQPIAGFSIDQCFHVSLVEKMIPCSDDVKEGWIYNPETGDFTDPEAPEVAFVTVSPVVEDTHIEPEAPTVSSAV